MTGPEGWHKAGQRSVSVGHDRIDLVLSSVIEPDLRETL